MVVISNTQNKYIAAKETSWGESPSPFTAIDIGQIRTINISEEENVTKLSSLNSGHLNALFEDGLYFVNVSIETLVSKSSLPVLLEACLGGRADATDYTITSSTTLPSYSIKASFNDGYSTASTEVALINGFTVKDWSISITKGEAVVITMNGIAKKVSKSTESIAPSTNTDEIFMDLDAKATIGGNPYILNSISLNGNWNITDDEGRGIEAVDAGDRRLIQRVVKHIFDVSGSYEVQVEADTGTEFGYTESRSDEAIAITISRGSDNEHVFTLSKTRSSGRTLELSRDNSARSISYDFEAIDCGITGDL